MEKRALLAAAVSAVVLVVWFAVFGPRSPQPVTPEAPGAMPPTASPVLSPAVSPVGSPAAPAGVDASVAGESKTAARGASEERVELRGGAWSGVLSSAGGVLVSLQLDEHKDDAGKPLELLEAGGARPLSLVAEGPWNLEPYQVSSEGGWTVLRWSDGAGAWVEKRLRPAEAKYGLDVRISTGGAAAGGVVVGGGLAGAVAKGGTFARSGAVVGTGSDVERVNLAKVTVPQTMSGGVTFVGVEDQYFLLVLLPSAALDQVSLGGGHGVVVAARAGVEGTLFAGPKEHDLLAAYGRGMERTLSFGIFGFLSVVFLAAMRWIHSLTGNWGVDIVLLTAAIRVLLFPLTHKSTVAMRRMQALQPKMKAIQERYQDRAKRDAQARTRMNQEIMGLYKQEGVNPLGGCLPTLVQLPILWALYSLFAYAIELRHAPFVLWIQDLSAKDPTYVTPILMTASMVLQQRMTPQVGDPAQRRMFMLMPFIFGFMFMSFPAGLVLYWLVNNVLTIGQQMITERLLRDKQPRS